MTSPGMGGAQDFSSFPAYGLPMPIFILWRGEAIIMVKLVEKQAPGRVVDGIDRRTAPPIW